MMVTYQSNSDIVDRNYGHFMPRPEPLAQNLVPPWSGKTAFMVAMISNTGSKLREDRIEVSDLIIDEFSIFVCLSWFFFALSIVVVLCSVVCTIGRLCLLIVLSQQVQPCFLCMWLGEGIH
jgi:hypothetical protein